MMNDNDMIEKILRDRYTNCDVRFFTVGLGAESIRVLRIVRPSEPARALTISVADSITSNDVNALVDAIDQMIIRDWLAA